MLAFMVGSFVGALVAALNILYSKIVPRNGILCYGRLCGHVAAALDIILNNTTTHTGDLIYAILVICGSAHRCCSRYLLATRAYSMIICGNTRCSSPQIILWSLAERSLLLLQTLYSLVIPHISATYFVVICVSALRCCSRYYTQ